VAGFLGDDKWHDDMIRVVICDDAALLRRRIVVQLESESDIDVMAETADGEHVINVSRELAPDVVIVGMRIDLGGPRTAAGIREVVPSAHVVTSLQDEIEAVRAIKAGATGFLNRDGYQHAAAVVRAVSAGVVALPPLVAQGILAEYRALAETGASIPGLAVPALTDRERAVVTTLSKGQPYAVVVEELGLGDHTVRNLAANAVEKLHRYARTEAVAYAVGERLFQST